MNVTLTPQQIATLTAMGMAPQATGQPTQPAAPAVPFNVVANPNQFQQPYQQPAPQPAAPAPSAQPNILTQRIPAAPGIAAAFHNKTIQEVLDGFARTASTLQQLQRAPQQQQPAQPTVPQGFSQPQPAGQIQTPAGMTLESLQETIRQTVQQTVQQQSLPQLVLQTEQAVASQNQAYSNPAIRSRVQEIIGTLPPEQQAQRGMWDYAITLALGEQVQQTGQMPGFAQPNRAADAPYVVGQRTPDNYLNANAPAFVESPSGTVQYADGQRPPMTVAEAQFAKQLGLDPQQVAQHNQQAFGGFV